MLYHRRHITTSQINTSNDILVFSTQGAHFLLGEPGMGKMASVAMIAMKYVKGHDDLKNFDLVWTIRLKDVDKTSSLAELIIAQHNRLKTMDIPVKTIKAILRGKSELKILLIYDGYDEYSHGTNKEIDEAIDSTVGNFLGSDFSSWLSR